MTAMSDDNTYSYWETGNPPAEATVLTFDQLVTELNQYETIGWNQFTVKHWQTGAEFAVLDFMDQNGLGEEDTAPVEDDDDNSCDCDDIKCPYDHPDGQSQYESWWKGEKKETTENYKNAEWVVAELTDTIYGKWPEAWQIRRGNVIVRDRFTGQKWDGIDFLEQHADMQQRYLKEGLHAFWPDEYEAGLDYVPNAEWAD